MNIIEAMQHPALFKPWFSDWESWLAWRAFLKTIFGLPLSPRERQIFTNCTGRLNPPKAQLGEVWMPCGRKGGKSFILALIGVYIGLFKDWSSIVPPGKEASVIIVAADRDQAKAVLKNIRAFIAESEALAYLMRKPSHKDASEKGWIVADQNERIAVNKGGTVISFEIRSSSYRSVRGPIVICALLDEVAFWQSEDGASPDTEVLGAIRPGMILTKQHGAMLLAASSPYARKGALWEADRQHYGVEGDPVLVWKAATLTMNPQADEAEIYRALEEDPQHAEAEYFANFRTDVASFVPREVIEGVTVQGRFALPYVKSQNYVAFVDAAGGSGGDSFTLAIAHEEDGRAILDLVEERTPPFSPDTVIEEYANTIRAYGVTECTGDRFAGAWPVEKFRNHGITYHASDKPKSDIYLEALPMMNSGTVELLDNAKLFKQLIGLERKTSRGGRDTVDHPKRKNDDLANAVAGALVLAGKRQPIQIWGLGDHIDEVANEVEQAAMLAAGWR